MATTTSRYENFTGPAAENYERYFVPVIPAPLAEDLLELAKLQPGEQVLDIACGTGIVARLAADAVGPTGKVVGVDPAPDMLEVARSLSQASQTSIEWLEGPAEKLPVDDDSFDVITSQAGLMFVGDKAAAGSEIRRALAPDGRVVINVPGAEQPLYTTMAEALARHVNPELEGFVHAVFSLHDPRELERLLTDAGLSDVAAWSETKTFHKPSSTEWLWQYVNATPMGALFADVSDEIRAAVEADLVERWRPWVDDDGNTVYDQPIVWATARA